MALAFETSYGTPPASGYGICTFRVFIEATTNVVVGYAIATATQLAVFPLFGLVAALGERLAIGLAVVGVSLARG